MSYKITKLETGTSWKVETAEEVYAKVEDIVGDERTSSDIPYSIEASSWAELACAGESFEHNKFIVEAL